MWKKGRLTHQDPLVIGTDVLHILGLCTMKKEAFTLLGIQVATE